MEHVFGNHDTHGLFVCLLSILSSPGSFSHLGTLPGSDLVGLGAWVWADGSGSSCVSLLESFAGSGGGRGSWTPAELEKVSEGWIMQLEEEKHE